MKDLNEVVIAILAGIEGLITSVSREMISGFQKMDRRFGKIDDRLNKLELGQGHLRWKQSIS